MPYQGVEVSIRRDNQPLNRGDAGVFPILGFIGVSSGGVSVQGFTPQRATSGMTDAVISPYMTAAQARFRDVQYTPGTDFTVSGGAITWLDTKLVVPYLKSAGVVNNAGLLAANTYYYKVTAIKKIVAGVPGTYGETTASNELSALVTSNGKVTLKWSRVDLADGYRVYRSTVSGTEVLLREILGNETQVWEDGGVYTPGIATPPVANTAERRPPLSVADTAGYWHGDDASANLAALQAINNGSVQVGLDFAAPRNVGSINLTAAVSLADVASKVQIALRPALGTYGMFYGADAALNLPNIKAITAGGFLIALDGAPATAISGLNFAAVVTMDDVAAIIQAAVRVATTGLETCVWDGVEGRFVFGSDTAGATSSVAITAPIAPGVVDITLATLLNTANGYAINGVDSLVTCTYNAVAKQFFVTSPTLGAASAVAVLAGVGGTDLTTAARMYLVGGVSAAVAGTTGEKTLYDVDATIQGQNFFNPQYFFTVQAIEIAHGATSEIYQFAQKMMLPPPAGNGVKVLCLVGIPSDSRSAYLAAFDELGKLDVDAVAVASTDADVNRDCIAHCQFWSRDENKKERISFACLGTGRTAEEYVNFAAGYAAMNGVSVVFDNMSNEGNIGPLVAAQKLSITDRAQTAIGTAIATTSQMLSAGRVADTTVKYLTSKGVQVAWSDNGLFTVYDDVLTNNDDVPGILVENYLRKEVRAVLNAIKGKSKLLDRVVDRCGQAVANKLDSFVSNEWIRSYDPKTVSVVRAEDDPEAVDISFEYVRMRTLKRIRVSYRVNG